MTSTQKREYRRNRMKKFRIDELSSVDRPAQAPARAVIMKREEPVEKNGETIEMITSVEDGHAHVIRFYVEDGEVYVGYARNSESDSDHSHGVIRDDLGNIQIVMNAGHTHEVSREDMVAAVMAMITKQGPGDEALEAIRKAFPEITAPQTEDIQMDEKLQKAVDRLTAIVALPADQRAHFDAIAKVEEQDAFLAKSAEDRAAIVKPVVEKKAVDPVVVYTAADGTVFTKSDDPRLVAAIVEKDSKDKELAALRLEKSDREFEKRAETELAHLPGTIQERAALLKAVDGIKDETQRSAALKSLAAGNKANEANTTSLGTSTPRKVEKSAPNAELDELAKAHATEKGLPFAKAYAAVLDTPKGKELYNQHRESMISVPAN